MKTIDDYKEALEHAGSAVQEKLLPRRMRTASPPGSWRSWPPGRRPGRKKHPVRHFQHLTGQENRPTRNQFRILIIPNLRDGIKEAFYADPDKHPELAGIVEEARERMRAWNERELVTRPGKDVRGIIFNLQANYGCGVKAEPAPAAQEDDPITRSLKEAAHALRKTDGDPPLALHGQDRADL